ncbi:Conserved_hypothetical protein [Hexamita inflata]|uniref:Uncharacterized protein n=1 Tax=Hexamita inflata TaxID=28002 RepID=A0AA86QBW3_9EUKA|nr:Conserved hypothetical protein [Hexamita inflata]
MLLIFQPLLSTDFDKSTMVIAGRIFATSDITGNKRIDLFSQISDQCFRFYQNSKSLKTNSIFQPIGSDVKLENPHADICLENVHEKLVQMHAFDFNKNGLSDLFVTSYDSQEKKYKNYIYFRVGDEKLAYSTLFPEQKINYYRAQEIQETSNIPFPLRISGNYAPDLIYIEDNKIQILENNIHTKELFAACLSDNNDVFEVCFKHKTVDGFDGFTLQNKFFQIDLDGDCLPEFQFIATKASLSAEDAAIFKKEQDRNGFQKFDDAVEYTYLIQADKQMKFIQAQLLGQNVTGISFYDLRQSGAIDLVYTQCRGVSCASENSLNYMFNIQETRKKIEQCSKQSYSLEYHSLKLTSKPSGQKLEISDYKYIRQPNVFVPSADGSEVFVFEGTKVKKSTEIDSYVSDYILTVDLNGIGMQTLVYVKDAETKLMMSTYGRKSIGFRVNVVMQPNICSDKCSTNKLSFKPFGSVTLGAVFKISAAKMSGVQLNAYSYLSQPDSFAIQLPIGQMTIDSKAQYIDYFNAGADSVKLFEGIVPNSFTISNPYADWKLQMILPDVVAYEVVVAITSIAVLAGFLTTVVIMICREAKEDKWEKERVEKGFM